MPAMKPLEPDEVYDELPTTKPLTKPEEKYDVLPTTITTPSRGRTEAGRPGAETRDVQRHRYHYYYTDTGTRRHQEVRGGVRHDVRQRQWQRGSIEQRYEAYSGRYLYWYWRDAPTTSTIARWTY